MEIGDLNAGPWATAYFYHDLSPAAPVFTSEYEGKYILSKIISKVDILY